MTQFNQPAWLAQTHWSACVVCQVRPELVSLASSFRKTMRGAPLIGWFVQSPDEWDRPAEGNK